MGAICAAINLFVHHGAHVVAVGHSYRPTRRYLKHLERFGVTTTFVTGCEVAGLLEAIRPETKLIYLESPTTGYFEVLEIPPIAAAARERGIATIFDNSWATPFFQRPLEWDVDLVVHSASKYLNGHSDVVAGVVVGRDEELRRRLWREIELGGATLDPFAAWLMIRGLRTLPLRMQQHQKSALEVAGMLEEHVAVARVHHPGLESHPQHATARRQLGGYSGLFSIELEDASREAGQRVLNRFKLFRQGVSWGGYDSFCLGGTMFGHERDRPAWLIRLSVGLESTDDLIADVRQALEE
jgi:cystathionine beta-lyase/cystathionine gamma-synthase